MTKRPLDLPLVILLMLLIASGAAIFFSASLGILGRGGENFESIVLKHYLLGFGGGGIALFALSRVPFHIYRKYAYAFFLTGLFLTFAVFIPGVGMYHGGATRWINLGPITFQPSELLKIGTIIYAAALFASTRRRNNPSLRALLPLIGVLGLATLALILQPDIDNLVILFAALTAMYIVATGKWSHAIAAGFIGLLVLASVALVEPYIRSRIMTLISPGDFQGAGYQIKQSLIAVGSGGLTGRGFGQSIQKHSYLPEPIGDSIFAVYAEETGFIGSVFLVLLYLGFTLRGLTVASRVPDAFGGLLAIGIVILISAQSFINIAAMIGIIPLSGNTLVFVSHGGSALLVAMAQAGILLNISRYATL